MVSACLGGKGMVDQKKDGVTSINSESVRQIADQIFGRTDGNHPQLGKADNGFLDILQNGKPDLSASSIFIKKAVL
jgi:hypothetical protein